MTPDELTPREREIVREIAEGRSYAAIAMKLQMSINTVNTHVTAIAEKLKDAGVGEPHYRAYRRIERWILQLGSRSPTEAPH